MHYTQHCSFLIVALLLFCSNYSSLLQRERELHLIHTQLLHITHKHIFPLSLSPFLPPSFSPQNLFLLSRYSYWECNLMTTAAVSSAVSVTNYITCKLV